MFDEGQLYSPVTQDEHGVKVHLVAGHPGANDLEYLERRGEIAAAAMNWEAGTPAPTIEYTEPEQNVWRTVCRELAPKHEELACRAYRDAVAALDLPCDRIPQVEEVSVSLEPLTGFTYLPAAGLVPLAEFYGALADRKFHSTQYIRHPDAPLYTPEPDLIHEVIGHGNLLASPEFAELNQLAGLAARRCETKEGLKFLADVFWFTIEFGVLYEEGELCAYGAGILSSYGEIDEFRSMEIRPIDYLEMGTTDYDITQYQPVLYAAESMGHLVDSLGSFLTDFGDDTPERLKRSTASVAR